ncbi:MAG: M23 family metallopeptidase [Candidatus Eremiobacteraeota bacterium]|nr:M23 family metallopeptidase [Candidatus Eremiobacteraeota bacterium]MBV8282625.1 M23 family metallopeptidase [Candidatus Eremiobacteraeota bacterium]
MWQQLNKIQAEHQEIKRLTTPSGGVSSNATPAADAQAEQNKAVKPTVVNMIEPSSEALPVHGPWWTQMAALIGIGRGGVSFENESVSLAMLDEGMDRVYSDAVKLKDEAAQREEVRIEASLAYQRMLDAIPSIWPTDGSITSGFGFRTYPDVGFHTGVDIVNFYGAPIVATASGTVVSAGWDYGFGIKVVIDHGNGYQTWYGHNSETFVSPGQFVHKGQLIAHLGATGFVTGPHVHYEVHVDGRPVNPVPFLSGLVGPTPAQLAAVR